MHSTDNRGRIRRVAISIGKIRGAKSKVNSFQKVTLPKPNACGHDPAIGYRIIGGWILHMPAVLHRVKHLPGRLALLSKADHHINTLPVWRLRTDQRCRFADDHSWVLFRKAQA